MNNSEQQAVERYTDKFANDFMDIAKYADRGNDVAYGKCLATLQNNISKFILSERSLAKQELIRKILKKQTDGVLPKVYVDEIKEIADREGITLD